jgi:hypothetical protein
VLLHKPHNKPLHPVSVVLSSSNATTLVTENENPITKIHLVHKRKKEEVGALKAYFGTMNHNTKILR